jgi:hypothetical protein
MSTARPATGPIAAALVAGLAAGLAGCSASAPLPRHAGGSPAGATGAGAELVMPGALVEDLGEGWEYARRDAALLAHEGQRAPAPGSLTNYRRLYLRPIFSDYYLYFEPRR